MNIKHLISLSFPLFFLSCTTAYAQPNTTHSKQPSLIRHCPEISQIKYNLETKKWQSGSWIGDQQSFEKKLLFFRGAQWRGVGVGNMMCVYKGGTETGFPVVLQYTEQNIPEPKGNNWGKDIGGRKNCPPEPSGVAVSVYDCPFELAQPKQEQDPYEYLKSLKKKK